MQRDECRAGWRTADGLYGGYDVLKVGTNGLPQSGQIMDLPLFDAVGGLIGQRAPAFLRAVHFGMVGFAGHFQRVALMAGLTAGFAAALFAQALGLGFHKGCRQRP